VLRKLYQDVAAFRSFLAEAASATGLPEETVAAKVVGRWRDGTPLVLSPDRPDPRISGSKDRVNDFRYGADRDGARCPLGAHIRRTNPRDEFGCDGRLTRRHRIIRRGMPYGPPFSTETEHEDRGLMFLCFNADIARQFETIQARWCNDGNVFGLDTERDLLANQPRLGEERPNKMTIHGPSPALLVQPDRPFVVTRGGEYLFAPGIPALRAIAGADW
ncbi:MAG: Dyp-type peroxidase, partial [Acidimicrobiales bacterium]